MNIKRFYYINLLKYSGEICDDCNKPVAKNIGSYWVAKNSLWNEVVNDGMLSPKVLCPLCFFKRATYERVPMHWEAIKGV